MATRKPVKKAAEKKVPDPKAPPAKRAAKPAPVSKTQEAV